MTGVLGIRTLGDRSWGSVFSGFVFTDVASPSTKLKGRSEEPSGSQQDDVDPSSTIDGVPTVTEVSPPF